MPLRRKRPDDAPALVDDLLASIDEFLAARNQRDGEGPGSGSPVREPPPEADRDSGAARDAERGSL